jgi:hypothetical protein
VEILMFPIRECWWGALINLTDNYVHSLLLNKDIEFSIAYQKIYLENLCLVYTSSRDGFLSTLVHLVVVQYSQ